MFQPKGTASRKVQRLKRGRVLQDLKFNVSGAWGHVVRTVVKDKGTDESRGQIMLSRP